MDFSPDPTDRSDADYLEEFEDLLIDATRIRLRADVPVGAYLSGGLEFFHDHGFDPQLHFQSPGYIFDLPFRTPILTSPLSRL